MRPREAADKLRLVAQAVASATSLPPSVRGWFGLAVMKRLNDPDTHLDQLLGLRQRGLGRVSLYSRILDRDAALRVLAASTGLPTAGERADEIIRRAKAGDLAAIQEYGRIPGRRQLLRILANDI